MMTGQKSLTEKLNLFLTTAFLLVVAVLLMPSEGRSQEGRAPKGILVVYWYNKDFPGNAVTDQYFQSVLNSQPPGSIEYYAEYLESNRFPGEDQYETLRDFLRRKYANRSIDVIVANSDATVEFFRRYRNDLFPNTPIVFAAARLPSTEELESGPGMTGLVYHQSYKENVELLLKLHPDSQNVFVISGSLQHDRRFETAAREDLRDYEGKVSITYLTDLLPSELALTIKSIPQRSVILYVWQQGSDESGKLLESSDFMNVVVNSATVPIYGQASWHVGKGAVGGYVRSAESSAMREAEIAIRVANGERAQDIPVEKSPVLPLFDWRELKRWGISEDLLPAGSTIQFRPVTFWGQYKWYAIGVISIVLLQSGLIAGLILNRTVRKRVEKALRKSEEQYRSIFETSGVAIWEEDFSAVKGLIDELQAQGVTDLRSYLRNNPSVARRALELARICHINQQTLKLFGARTKSEFLSSLDRIYVPETEQVFVEKMIALVEGHQYLELETVLRTLQGERRHMFETITFPDKPGADDRVIVTVLDITERKEAGEALMNLSGQLIQAREEECARIARELHDDVSQNVALISLGLDQLSQHPPQSQQELREMAQEIFKQTRELSTGIHRMSHDLHPSKLDQLGLVTSLRSLCAELSRSYALRIEFKHEAVPPTLQKEISICLYRVVQESLNNVIKYSGAKDACVELRGNGRNIHMRIEDWGKGFEVESAKKGLGLLSMRERLRLVGGTVSIDSRISLGTKIDVSVPLAPLVASGEGVCVTTASQPQVTE
jgi:signal transduction histidine kinase/ABC-type uncharacterized transport system substrate-binding protein